MICVESEEWCERYFYVFRVTALWSLNNRPGIYLIFSVSMTAPEFNRLHCMHVTFLGRIYLEFLLLGSDSASLVILYFHVKLFILIGWETFDENHDHPLIMKLRHNTLWNLSTGESAWWRVIFQKYLDSGFMCGRFTVDSYWRHPNVWI